MSHQIFMDGVWVQKEEAKIPISDHGLLYGDGIFEGIRVYNGRVFKLDEHLERLYRGAKAIKLDIGMPLSKLKEEVVESVRRNNFSDAYIRLVVTRGPGDLGLDPRKCAKASVFIWPDKIAVYPEEIYKKGLKVMIASTRRIPPDSLSPMVKSLNYLNNILAKIESNQAGFDEAIMLNHEGYIAEGTVDNIFLVKGEKLLTPPCSAGALQGITRQTIIDLAPSLGYTVEEALLTAPDLYWSDECFLTGTGAELVPVVEADRRTIGNGTPGPVTLKILAAYRDYTKTSGTPVYSEKVGKNC